mmetsp:Transcript_56569/g.106578  ORF Transcript_56569/g.106578 Transcript_56569/m.106578 type:complete len:366 (-) Transcript_56569:107-1204(-)
MVLMAHRRLDVSKIDVIFAEDEIVFQELALSVLEKVGIRAERVYTSGDGSAALDDFERLQVEGETDLPILVFLDVRMPTMDGVAAGCRMQERMEEKACRRQAFLASCSANVIQACVNDVVEGQPFRFTMTKPISLKEVQMCVHEFNNWWLRLNGESGLVTPSVDELPAEVSTVSVAKLESEACKPIPPEDKALPSAPPEFASLGESSAEPAMEKAASRECRPARDAGDFSSIDIMVADSEPICRMAIVDRLDSVGGGHIDPEAIIEADGFEETQEALREWDSEDKASRPLVLFLGDSSWYSEITEMKLNRKPLIVFTLVDSEEMLGHLDLKACLWYTVLPTSQTQEDLRKVLEECLDAFDRRGGS